MSNSEIVIALDAMGGDGAPDVVIRGANIARVRYPQLRFKFFGKESAITAGSGEIQASEVRQHRPPCRER